MLIAVVFEIMFIWLLSARSVECSCCVELCYDDSNNSNNSNKNKINIILGPTGI